MILNNVHFEPYEDKARTVNIRFGDNSPDFPILRLDKDSYIVSAQIQSDINFDKFRVFHNLLIGKFCSLADSIKFMVGLNHDYESVTTGVCSFLKGMDIPMKIARKNQILLQNDVWIGSGATIMSGVVIHNGAVIACNAHVVKDVPPYAIVGGNPAKVIKYRFSEDQIEKLLKISWWDWSDKKLEKYRHYFFKSVNEFIDQFYEENSPEIPALNYNKTKPICLFFPDFDDSYPVTEHVIRNFCKCEDDIELMMYLNSGTKTEGYVQQIQRILKKLKSEDNNNIVLLIDQELDERSLFNIADFYITSRAQATVTRTCLADKYNVKICSGVDDPIF
mgnify:CR=1 FL=1